MAGSSSPDLASVTSVLLHVDDCCIPAASAAASCLPARGWHRAATCYIAQSMVNCNRHEPATSITSSAPHPRSNTHSNTLHSECQAWHSASRYCCAQVLLQGRLLSPAVLPACAATAAVSRSCTDSYRRGICGRVISGYHGLRLTCACPSEARIGQPRAPAALCHMRRCSTHPRSRFPSGTPWPVATPPRVVTSPTCNLHLEEYTPPYACILGAPMCMAAALQRAPTADCARALVRLA